MTCSRSAGHTWRHACHQQQPAAVCYASQIFNGPAHRAMHLLFLHSCWDQTHDSSQPHHLSNAIVPHQCLVQHTLTKLQSMIRWRSYKSWVFLWYSQASHLWTRNSTARHMQIAVVRSKTNFSSTRCWVSCRSGDSATTLPLCLDRCAFTPEAQSCCLHVFSKRDITCGDAIASMHQVPWQHFIDLAQIRRGDRPGLCRCMTTQSLGHGCTMFVSCTSWASCKMSGGMSSAHWDLCSPWTLSHPNGTIAFTRPAATR